MYPNFGLKFLSNFGPNYFLNFGTIVLVPNSVPIFVLFVSFFLAYSSVVSFCCFLISFLTMVVFDAYLIPISQSGPCNLGPNEILIFSDDVLLVSY